MAGSGRLDRIAALTDLLAGVTGRQRGEPIEAAQWNTIVDVLRGILDIDRSQEAGLAQSLAADFSPADHTHLGQVSLAWLDPDLQDRQVVGGGGGPVAIRGTLTDLNARVGDLAGQVSTVSTRLESMQRRADDSAVDELNRSQKLRGLETRFNGVDDLRALVGSIAAQMQDLGPRVQTVLDLRAELTADDGTPINVRSLDGEVVNLTAALAEATSGVDGAVLRMRDLQLAIQELQDIAGVGPGGLEQRFATLAAELQAGLDSGLDARFGQQQQDLQALVDQRFEVLSQVIDNRIAGLAEEVTKQVLEQAGDQITEVVLGKVTEQLNAIVDARLEQVLARLTKAINTLEERVARLEGKVFG